MASKANEENSKKENKSLKLKDRLKNKSRKVKDKLGRESLKLKDKFETESVKSKEKLQDAVDHVSPYWFTLKEIIKTDKQNYTKCVQLLDQFAANATNTSIEKLHDASDHQNTWASIKSNAEKCQNALYLYLQRLKQAVEKTNKLSKSQSVAIEVIQAPTKKYERAKQKVDLNYEGNWLRLLDACRSCLVHDNFQQLYYVLFILCTFYSNCYGFEIVRIKNRYQKPTDQGWADVVLLVRPSKHMDAEYAMDETEDSKMSMEQENILKGIGDVEIDNASLPQHICEIQLIHRAMWEKRKHGLFGHKAYKVQRDVDSASIKVGASVGMAKHVNDVVDWRNKVVGNAGQKVFVKDQVKTEPVKSKEVVAQKQVDAVNKDVTQQSPIGVKQIIKDVKTSLFK